MIDPRIDENIAAGLEEVLEDDGRPSSKRSAADVLVEIALERGEFFHAPDGKPYVSLNVGDHRETHPLRGAAFRDWLARSFYEEKRKAPGTQAVQNALGVLAGEALYGGDERPAHVRLGGSDDVIYLDLGDPNWSIVEITAAGWTVGSGPAVRMRRPSGFAPLPVPVPDGSLDELRPFVNVATEADFQLLVGFMVGALRPRGPYPVPVLHGEHGSAKSTTARMMRNLLDPSTAPLRAQSREPRDLAVSAENSRVLAFDNLSHLPGWFSDALCRLATGGGFSVRTLYENAEETIFEAMRPVILNGIEEIATRADLLDRALILYLPTIKRRRSEKALWAAFERARPRILGALLDAASCAMRNISTTKLEVLPRMADFAEWVVAAEPALPWQPGAFMRAYTDNRSAAHEIALEASPFAGSVRQLAAQGFEGRAKDLLAAMNALVDENTIRSKEWPKSPPAARNALLRIAPDLRAIGVEIHVGDRRSPRPIRIRTQETVATVATVANPLGDRSVERRFDARHDGSGVGHDGWDDGSEGSDSAPDDGSDGSDGSLRSHSHGANRFDEATDEQLDLADRIVERHGGAA